ncbi:Bdr family repetitive protein [Borrelia turicatae]|uniref:Borrelia Direct Repeat protein 9 n=1 Tax=Borrelia turicatae (strain 91E135) TaxID=314724 RepID=A0ABF7R059_BORT9|nr:Bdr family repetitive protein [Borrelia turicatae]ASJ27798.1 Borrelia Direct Repeat protein 9 [Borrelia turicatae 91E135]UPA14264.1 hypothetical protein bt91E135_001445 [Borrelia turicatae 91E135]
MGLAQPVVTQQMVINELTKAGINRDIAIDLSYRYYKNELTYKDIEYLETTFNLKLEKVEATLQADIRDLDNKIVNVKNELKSDIKDLDNKIDVNKMELKSTLRLHGWMFGTIITLNIGIFLTLISIVYSLLNR